MRNQSNVDSFPWKAQQHRPHEWQRQWHCVSTRNPNDLHNHPKIPPSHSQFHFRFGFGERIIKVNGQTISSRRWIAKPTLCFDRKRLSLAKWSNLIALISRSVSIGARVRTINVWQMTEPAVKSAIFHDNIVFAQRFPFTNGNCLICSSVWWVSPSHPSSDAWMWFIRLTNRNSSAFEDFPDKINLFFVFHLLRRPIISYWLAVGSASLSPCIGIHHSPFIQIPAINETNCCLSLPFATTTGMHCTAHSPIFRW